MFLKDIMTGRMNARKFINSYQEFFKGSREMYAPPYDHIVQVGDPVLRYKAKPVNLKEIETDNFFKLLIRMKNVLKRFSCEGLSAPQIGIDKRIFMVQLTQKMINLQYEKSHQRTLKIQPIPLQVWINPKMKIIDYSTETFSEGCGSMQGFTADVKRYSRVLLNGFNEVGEEKTVDATGWYARIIQHEMDHLDGKLYIDSMIPQSLECCSWSEINKNKGNVFITYAPMSWWKNFWHPSVK